MHARVGGLPPGRVRSSLGADARGLPTVTGHPLLDVVSLDTDDVGGYLARIGQVFVLYRGHDSRNTSAGVRIGPQAWFVKWASESTACDHLETAVRFHRAVTHPAIIPLRASFATRSGLAIVHNWVDGMVLNDPLVPGGRHRDDPASVFARFRRLPMPEILAAFDTVLDAHLAVAEAGFVAVDFYDGCLIYDFDRRVLRLCDLDLYRPGPYVLNTNRQYGSTRFMAPEEFIRGATIDERTTVFTLGRTAFVLLSRGRHGEEDRTLWGATGDLFDVARHATRPEPKDRFGSVRAMSQAWRAAFGRSATEHLA